MNAYEHMGDLVSVSIALMKQIEEFEVTLRGWKKHPGSENSPGVIIITDRLTRANEDLLFNNAEIVLARERYKRRIIN